MTFIDLLRGEHIRSKVYASCVPVLKKSATCSFRFRGFKRQKTVCAEVFKAPKQEITYREGIYRLKSKNPLMSHKYAA